MVPSQPSEAEAAEVARAEAEAAALEAEQADALEALAERARAAVQAAQARVAALPVVDAGPEGAGERLPLEKRAERLAKRNAALQAQLTEAQSQVADRDAQATLRDARIATLEASAAKAQDDLDEERMCCVCLEKPKTHALVPCGHVCACEGCAKDKIMATDGLCPMCRTQSAQILQVYVCDRPLRNRCPVACCLLVVQRIGE